MSKWWRDFSVQQKIYSEKRVSSQPALLFSLLLSFHHICWTTVLLFLSLFFNNRFLSYFTFYNCLVILFDFIFVCLSVRFHSYPTTSSLPLSASLVNLIVSIYDFGCLISSLISSLHLLIYAFFYKRDDKLNILKYS